MIRILCIGDESDCRDIQSCLRIISDDSEEKISVYFKRSPEASWESYFFNPLMYDYIIADLGESNDSLKNIINNTRLALEVNSRVKVIFMTFRAFIPVQIFDVPHIHLLRRPLTMERVYRLKEIVTEGVEKTVAPEDRMAVYQNKIVRFVDRRYVIYLKKTRGGTTLMMEGGQVYDERRIDELVRENEEYFMRCHNSHAVNIMHVLMVDMDRVYMDNGEDFSISRARKKEVAEFIANNIRKKHKKA